MPAPAQSESNRVERLKTLDRLCDEFESGWNSGSRPTLSNFLSQTSADVRQEAFVELLAVELAYRRGKGEQPSEEEYARVYPDYSELVHREFMTPDMTQLVAAEVSTNTPPAAIENDQRLPLRIDDYELLSKIGEGGMGAVYKARNTKLDKIVALKVLPKDKMQDKSSVARFEREMRAVGKLDHPHIVRAMDAGEENGMHFLVMEYVQGIDLSQLVKQLGPLPVAEACELIRQAAAGLDAAHDHGMVHRDIKPSNLMLCVPGKRQPPIVKILDMGLALLSEAHSPDVHGLTSTGQMMGTVDYMAPEQGDDSKSVDIRADLYSLGASLYKLLTGETVYHGGQYQTLIQKMMALASKPAPPIRECRADIPPELAALVHRLLEKDPAQRFATPEEVAQALAPFAAGANLAALLTKVGDERLESAVSDDVKSHATPSAAAPDLDTGATPRHALPAVGWPPSAVSLVGTESQRTKASAPDHAPSPQTSGASRPPARPNWLRWPRVLVTVGALATAVLLGIVVLTHLERFGNKSGETFAPAHGAPPATWPIDALRREQIPEQQLRIAGHGDPSQAPAELVAILGDGRLRHWAGVDSVAFSPDGKLLASGCGDYTVRLWDITDGGLVRSLIGRPTVVWRVAFSPDSQIVASGAADGTVVLWEVATGTARRSLEAHKGRLWCLTFSGDGLRLASGGEDGKIRIWHASTGEELGTLIGSSGPVETVVFLPNSNSLVSGGADGKVQLWDLDNPSEPSTLRAGQGRVVSLACSRDGRLLAFGIHVPGVLDVIKVLDMSTKNELHTLSPQPGVAAHLAFRPDGQVLACAAHTQFAVRLWEMETGRELPALLGHQWGTSNVAFHPDGRRVASGGWDGTIRMWDSFTAEELLPRTGHQSWANGLAFSPDGRLLATGSRDNSIKLWDPATGQELHTLTGHRAEITSLEFRRDGRLLASGSADGTAKLWETETWKLRTLIGHRSDVRCVAFNRAGGKLASASADGTVILWEAESGQESRLLSGHAGQVNAVAWAPDDLTLASGSPDGSVKIWEAATGFEMKYLAGHESWVESVAYSGDGTLLASAGNDHTVRLWDPHTGQPIRTLRGHDAQVHFVSFSPDSQVLASAAFDGTIRLWDPADGSCRQVVHLGPPGASITEVTFSPDGRHLAAANGNGTVYILRLQRPDG